MQLNPDLGSFERAVMTIRGLFRVNGTTDPDGVRTGNTNLFTVSRVSQGLFEVTIAGEAPLPKYPTYMAAHVLSSATPTRFLVAHVVVDSWNPATRKFSIATGMVGDTGLSAYADPVVQDPNDNDQVCFKIEGSIMGTGTDAA